MLKRLLLASLLSVALGRVASAETLFVIGTFKAEHGVTTTPTGGITGRFDSSTDKLDYDITYHGLTGPVIAAHFHGPAKPDANAGVLQPIGAPYASPIKGTVTFTAAQANDLEHGLIYVNLHTGAHPEGEARAQLDVRANP